MASDEDYMAFLNKANEDPAKRADTNTSTQSKGINMQFKAVDTGVTVPQNLVTATEKEEWIYMSDADEPFVPVALKMKAGSKKLPDEHTFATLIAHPEPKHADVEIMDIVEWDKAGQYKAVVDAVREACAGSDVRVYRVARGGTRVEYWVVGVKQGQLVGVKALAIES